MQACHTPPEACYLDAKSSPYLLPIQGPFQADFVSPPSFQVLGEPTPQYTNTVLIWPHLSPEKGR